MRTRAALSGVFAAFAILTIGWQVGSAGVPENPAGTTGTTGTTGSPGTADGGPATSAGTGTTTSDGTYTGQKVSTQFGDVQVQVTVSGGTMTDVTALQLTDRDGRSVQISNRAAPILRSEALQAQSASVDTVSGATYTSEAYLTSLQSALDQAGL